MITRRTLLGGVAVSALTSGNANAAFFPGGAGCEMSKYPPAKPGALRCEPLKAADWGRLRDPGLWPPKGGWRGVAFAAPGLWGHLKVAG